MTSHLKRRLEKFPIDIHLNSAVNFGTVRELAPDAVVVATGGRLIMPKTPGIERDNVLTIDGYLKNRTKSCDQAIVVGGNYGAELAVSLARLGKQVTVVEESPTTAVTPYIYLGRMLVLQGYLAEEKVNILTETRVENFTDKGAIVVDKNGEEHTIKGRVIYDPVNSSRTRTWS